MYRSYTHIHSFITGSFISDKKQICFDDFFYYKSDLIHYTLGYYVKHGTCTGDVLL
jgi:hypothetical protein